MSIYNNSSVLVTGGTSTIVQGQGGSEFRALADHIAANALHNSGEVSDQPKCHPGTRVAILDHLFNWAAALTYPYPIVWLHGPAGAGKSAILRTIAQILFDQGLLLASFFFFRTSAGRNSSRKFIATLAYQVALAVPATRHHIEDALHRNPVIFSLSLWDQARALIASPIIAASCDPSFQRSPYPPVIIVDGLDECEDPDKQCEILDVLLRIGRMLQNVPIPFAVLVASRPEHHIRGAFDEGVLNESSTRLALDDSYEPDADIKKFLVDRFDTIRRSHVMKSYLSSSDTPWPSQEAVDVLVAKASGQFIYVATVDKFVSSPRHNPAKRLDIILGTLHAGSLKPFEQLDNLYSLIFQTIALEDLPSTLRVLGAVLLIPDHDAYGLKSNSPHFLEKFLKLGRGDIRSLLFDLESLLTVGESHESIHVYHASLQDYLFDRSRSGPFWIDTSLIYTDLAEHCIRHLLSWPDIREFLIRAWEFIISRAAPTPELSQALEDCDIESLSKVGAYGHDGLRDVCPTLIQGMIQKSKFVDPRRVFAVPLSIYQRLVSTTIQRYFENVALKTFLLTAVEISTNSSFFLHNVSLFREHFLSPEDVQVDSRRGFNLLNIGVPPSAISFIKATLEDKDGNCLINGYQYAEITLYIVKELRSSRLRAGLLSNPRWEDVLKFLITHLFSACSDHPDLIKYSKSIVSQKSQLARNPPMRVLKQAMKLYLERVQG